MAWMLFLIALAMGVLNLTGHLSVSWWIIALIWPVFPVAVALTVLGVTFGVALWMARR